MNILLRVLLEVIFGCGFALIMQFVFHTNVTQWQWWLMLIFYLASVAIYQAIN